MGKEGQATTFLTESDQEFFLPLREFLERNKQNVPNELKKATKSQMLEELVNN
jgi:hypothetical protein